MNRFAIVTGTAALSLVLASCSSSSKSTAPTASTSSSSAAASSAGSAPAASASGIVISGFAYSGTMTVKPGEKVTVMNQDSVAHTVTDKQTHLFDTGNIAGNGGTGTFTAPSKPGSYPFGCTYHPNMHGTLIVQG
jgi:plastocyanin